MRLFLTILLLSGWFCGLSQNNIAYLAGEELKAPELKPVEIPSNTSDFTFLGGLILTEASVDGQIGKYILDTGAPGLVLNSTRKTETAVFASSVNSTVEVGEVTVENFDWGNVEEKNIEAYTLDLSHMAKGKESNLDGLIGYQILENKAVLVDFENEKVTLLSKKDLKAAIKASPEVISIPFIIDGHLPVLKLKIDGRMYRFALDTGAEKNLLDKNLFDKMNPQKVKYELMQGLDGGIRKVAVGEVSNLKSKKYEIEKQEFLFSDLSAVNSGNYAYRIDGLLGLPFFQKKTFAVDYRKGKLHIWE